MSLTTTTISRASNARPETPRLTTSPRRSAGRGESLRGQIKQSIEAWAAAAQSPVNSVEVAANILPMACLRGRETEVTATRATAASTTTRGPTTEIAETPRYLGHVIYLDLSTSVIVTKLVSLVITTSQDTVEDVPLIPQVPARVPEDIGECRWPMGVVDGDITVHPREDHLRIRSLDTQVAIPPREKLYGKRCMRINTILLTNTTKVKPREETSTLSETQRSTLALWMNIKNLDDWYFYKFSSKYVHT